MGARSQRKGRNAERELAKIFQGYGYDVRPGVPVSFGAEPDLVGLKGIHCELKRREHVDLSAALKQAAADAEKFGDGVPCVFHRGNRQNWRVTMTLEGWLSLYTAADRKINEKPGKKVSNDGTAKAGLGGAADLSEQSGGSGGGGRQRQDRTKLFE